LWAGSTRHWTQTVTVTVKSAFFSVGGPSLCIAHSTHPSVQFAPMMSHQYILTISRRWMNKPPACNRGGDIDRCNRMISPGNDTAKKKRSHINDNNWNATDSIISQLSSPPNLLTLSRILATPYLSHLLISHNGNATDDFSTPTAVGAAVAPSSDLPLDAAVDAATASTEITSTLDPSSAPVFALSLFLLLGFTDFLDGYIARKFPKTATVLGTYLDPLADKIFISMTSLALCYVGSLPGMLVGLWITRDVGNIIGSYLYLKETIRKYRIRNPVDNKKHDGNGIALLDLQHTPLKIQASFMSKVNTTLQISLIALGIAGEVPSIVVSPELMTSLIWITAGTTIFSSLGYLDGSALKKTRAT